jgi:hypothetical protein
MLTGIAWPDGGLDRLWQPKDPATKSARVSRVVSIPPGSTVTLAEIAGPGVIRHLWFTAQCDIPQVYGLLVFRAWWDGEPHPSVEAPLGDFIGVGFGQEREMRSQMSDMYPAGAPNHAALNTYWPMPFRKSARLTVENRGERVVSMFFSHVDYEKTGNLPPKTQSFHALWRRENPVTLHKPYTILEARGTGCYAGTVMNYHLLQPGAWVEGGDNFHIDGDTSPTLPGTGTEDYFGHAWGFRRETGAAWHGTSLGPEDSRATAYRWHVPDPVWFDKSIRVTLRCHGTDVGDRQDDYSSVAFWYQTEPHAPFPPLPPPDYDYLGVAEEFRVPFASRFAPERLNPPPPGENLARAARAWRASGRFNEESDGGAAIDGRTDTKWCDGGNAGNQWLALDLGTTRILTGFILKNASFVGEQEGFDTLQFRVDTAPDLRGPWLEAAAVDNATSPTDESFLSAINTVHFPVPVKARCIRLFVTRPCALDAIARIPEFEVYGMPLAAGRK